MSSTRRLTWVLVAVLVGSFGLLGFFGREVYRQAPPIPERVVEEGTGRVLATREGILDGQQAWQSMGGQQVGGVAALGVVAPAGAVPEVEAQAAAVEQLQAAGTAGLDEQGLLHEVPDVLDRAVEPLHMPHLQDQVVPPCQAQQVLRLFHPGGDGFFHQEVDPPLQGFLGDLVVDAGGDHDADGVGARDVQGGVEHGAQQGAGVGIFHLRDLRTIGARCNNCWGPAIRRPFPS